MAPLLAEAPVTPGSRVAVRRYPTAVRPTSSNRNSNLGMLDSDPGTDIETSESSLRALVAGKIAENIPEFDTTDDDYNCNRPTSLRKVSRIPDRSDIHIEETHGDLNRTWHENLVLVSSPQPKPENSSWNWAFPAYRHRILLAFYLLDNYSLLDWICIHFEPSCYLEHLQI